MATPKITSSSSPDELKKVVAEFGNCVVNVTDSIIFFAENDTQGFLHHLNSLKNKTFDKEKLQNFIESKELDDQMKIEIYEICPEVFDESAEIFKPGLDLYCRGRSEKFFKLFEGVVGSETPRDCHFVDAAKCNKKTFELLLIYHKHALDTKTAAKIIVCPETPLESIKCMIDKLQILEDLDEIVSAFLERFGSLEVGGLNFATVLRGSKFEKTLKLIAKKDQSKVLERLQELGLIQQEISELITLFCKEKSVDCLRIALLNCDAMLTHEDILICDENLIRLAASKRAVKSPEKLLDLVNDKLFEFVREIYREIPSNQLTNKSNSAAIAIAENIKSDKDFVDLEEGILPYEVLEEADYFTEHLLSVKLPKKELCFAMYLAVLKRYRKRISGYDIEAIFRREDIATIIKNDSTMLIEVLTLEREYFDQESD